MIKISQVNFGLPTETISLKYNYKKKLINKEKNGDLNIFLGGPELVII